MTKSSLSALRSDAVVVDIVSCGFPKKMSSIGNRRLATWTTVLGASDHLAPSELAMPIKPTLDHVRAPFVVQTTVDA